jgi:hypothetical protein
MKVANRNTERFGLLRGVWADLLRWIQGRKYNDSDCCGGLEAVGRLLALDSRCFQKLRQIPTKSVFLALDSRSFLKLRWIPTKKSVCAGFQYCCAGLRFSQRLRACAVPPPPAIVIGLRPASSVGTKRQRFVTIPVVVRCFIEAALEYS